MIDVLFLIFLSIAFYFLVSMFWPVLTGGAGYTPTPRTRISQAMELAKVGPNDIFYDLGCGTGSALAQATKRGAKVVGVEIEPLRWLACRLRMRSSKVIFGSMFNIPLNDATVIFIFQYPNVNRRLKQKFERELRSGTKVVSYAWKIDGWKPARSIGDLYLYVYGGSGA
jgi:SAM-dependent methyltransferase